MFIGNQVHHSLPADFVEEAYAAKVEVKDHDNCILEQLCNHDYEADLTGPGARLHIRTQPELVARDWAPGTPFVPQNPTSDAIVVEPGQALEVSFPIDDFQLMNMSRNLPKWEKMMSDSTSVALAEEKERRFFFDLPSFADAANQGYGAGLRTGSFTLGTATDPILLTDDNTGYTAHAGDLATMDAAKLVLDADTVLAEQPGYDIADKWIVMPPAMLNFVRKNKIFAEAQRSGDNSTILRQNVLAQGRFGVSGFKVYVSNKLPFGTMSDGTKYWYIPFGDIRGITYASIFSRVDRKDETKTVGVQYNVATQGFDWWPIHKCRIGTLCVAFRKGA